MDESLDSILKEFSELVLKEQFTEAEDFIAKKIKHRKAKRKKLVHVILAEAIRIGDSEKSQELQRYTIALNYLRICMKLNRQKRVKRKIETLLADVHFNLGLVFDRSERFDEAEASYREAIRMNPTLTGAYNNLGIVVGKLGRLTESEAVHREVLKINPNEAIVNFNLAITLDRLGRFDEAEVAYRKALEINPRDENAYNNLGNMLLQSGRLDEAEVILKKALKINPKLAEAHFNLGITLRKLGRLKESEIAYRETLKINPNDAEAYNNLGNVLKDLGRFDDAEAAYRKAVRINPKLALAYNNLGNLLWGLGRFDEALAAYRETLKIDPKRAEAHFALAFALDALGKLDEAEASYREVLRINPKDAAAYNNLGNTLRELRRLKEAEVACREALKINSKLAEPYNVLGLISRDLGRLDEAEACFKEALRINPKLAEAHFNLGIVLFRTYKFDEALSSLNVAIRIFTQKDRKEDLAYAKAYRAWIDGFKAWQTGNLEKGEKDYISASKFFAKSGEKNLSSVLALIAKHFRIDRDYLSYIKSDDLKMLRKGILILSQKIQKTNEKIRKIPFPEIEILDAKRMCIQFLKAVLLFKPIDYWQLEKAKEVFSKHKFLYAYEGANAIDTFRIYLNTSSPSKNLNDVQREQEMQLFEKLNPAIGLDGIITQQIARLVVDRLKPELVSAVAGPIVREETKTRQVITQKMGRIEERLESMQVTLLGIEQEIAIKRVAHSEFEIIFPVPYGVYKIHIPAGEITTQDITNMKIEISKILAQVMQKAKQNSVALYNEFKKRRQEITQRILAKLKKLRDQNAF